MLPSRQLQDLLDAGRIDSAIELCEMQIQHGAVKHFYRFWLDKLKLGNVKSVSTAESGSSIRSNRPIQFLSDAPDFSASEYVFTKSGFIPENKLDQEKQVLLSKSPFKSAIYLPTQRIPLPDQISGLRRVNDLLTEQNLSTSAARFSRLREWIKERGTKRILVVGNGPSLKRTDLSLLQDEITIGFNGIFLHDSFKPTIYIVEDHLVAEDRAKEIRDYACPIKIFPSYLAYCIEAQENTIFLNHRSRISYPVDTDFSNDAGNITYTGGTVTYTGLQVAASLGVEQIILIGVDASYRVHNVDRDTEYGTGVLTSKEDDTNHFDPRYFGKGYRWHDPNVHTMLQAYRKARKYGLDNNVKLVNATIEGELEVFPRTNYYQLFPHTQASPRLAVLDFTSIQRLSATGIVKRNLLQEWPKFAQLHVCCDEKSRLIAFQHIPNDLYAAGSDDSTVWAAFRSVVEYDPEVLYLRPTHDRQSMTVLQVVYAALSGRPWVVHYMDDWLKKIHVIHDRSIARAHEQVMEWLFNGAAEVLTICSSMSTMLENKYHIPLAKVHAVHNMLPHQIRAPHQDNGSEFIIRYFGGMEPDMGLATIMETVQQVEQLTLQLGDRRKIRLELVLNQYYIKLHAKAFERFTRTKLVPQYQDYQDYLTALSTSNLNLICYNFDQKSVDYTRYSLANKLPELIASGVPILAIGHPEIGTMQLLKEHNYPWLLTTADFKIHQIVADIFNRSEESNAAWRRSIELLKDEFSFENNAIKFYNLLRKASRMPRTKAARPPIQALQVLLHGSNLAESKVQDLDLLVQLLYVEPPLLESALVRVRGHGRLWSVHDEMTALIKLLKSPESLMASSSDTKVRALAFLIAGLGHVRYQAVNGIIIGWLRNLRVPA